MTKSLFYCVHYAPPSLLLRFKITPTSTPILGCPFIDGTAQSPRPVPDRQPHNGIPSPTYLVIPLDAPNPHPDLATALTK